MHINAWPLGRWATKEGRALASSASARGSLSRPIRSEGGHEERPSSNRSCCTTMWATWLACSRSVR